MNSGKMKEHWDMGKTDKELRKVREGIVKDIDHWYFYT